MKVKYLDGSYWSWLESCDYKIKHIDREYNGWISLITNTKVKYRLMINSSESEYCVFDNDYECIVFLPDEGQWCLSAIYDNKGNIIEWYFDIIKDFEIDDQGNPFYYDLYLDVTLNANNQITILDEDELKEALELDVISTFDYELAYRYCDNLVKGIVNNKYFLNDFLNMQRVLLKGEIMNER